MTNSPLTFHNLITADGGHEIACMWSIHYAMCVQ